MKCTRVKVKAKVGLDLPSISQWFGEGRSWFPFPSLQTVYHEFVCLCLQAAFVWFGIVFVSYSVFVSPPPPGHFASITRQLFFE